MPATTGLWTGAQNPTICTKTYFFERARKYLQNYVTWSLGSRGGAQHGVCTIAHSKVGENSLILGTTSRV